MGFEDFEHDLEEAGLEYQKIQVNGNFSFTNIIYFNGFEPRFKN